MLIYGTLLFLGAKIFSWFILNPILELYLIFYLLGNICYVALDLEGSTEVTHIGGGYGGEPMSHGGAMKGFLGFPLVSK